MSLVNRRLAWSFLAVSAAASAGAEDLTLVFKESGGGGPAGTSSQYFTTERMRQNQADRDVIFEYATGKIVNIDHKKKEYSEVTLAEIEAQMKAMSAEMEKNNAQMQQQMEKMPPAARAQMEKMMGGIASAVTVTKGATRKVAGYDCQEFTIAMGTAMKNETCNTTALKFPIPEADFKRFSSFGGVGAMASNPMFKGMAQMAEKMKEIQGIPLASTTSVSIMGKNSVSGREAVEVKRGPVDASVFALPAGYKKVSSPLMKGARS